MRNLKPVAWLFVFVCFLPLVFAGCAHNRPHTAVSPAIYDPTANGEEQLRAALVKARKQHKHVLLDLGANWCRDSQAMYRLLREDPAIRQQLRKHFVLAMVDVNDKDGPPRNQALVERLGNPLGRGIPVLLILDAEGTLLNRDPNERLADDAHKRPPEVLAYLRKWAPEP